MLASFSSEEGYSVSGSAICIICGSNVEKKRSNTCSSICRSKYRQTYSRQRNRDRRTAGLIASRAKPHNHKCSICGIRLIGRRSTVKICSDQCDKERHRREVWLQRTKDPAAARAYDRQYAAKNRDKLNAKQNARYAANSEAMLERSREYRAKNKDRKIGRAHV